MHCLEDEDSWFRRNWSTVTALIAIFLVALFLRAYFAWDLAAPEGLLSGGSDSFYYERILRHAFETGKQLNWDFMLSYPDGVINPRPPLFVWFILVPGLLASPFFGSPWEAVKLAFLLSTALWGALTIFPTYALAKEAFGRRTGLLAAFLLAVLPAHMQRSQATDADHDSFVLFFVVAGFYFFMRALKTLKEERWIQDFRKPRSIALGLNRFAKENRKPVLYSLLSAFSLATIALTWQGFAYAPIIILAYFNVQLLVHRVRNQDPTGIAVCFALALGIALLVAAPWYFMMQQVRVWFDVPLYLYAASLLVAAIFSITRDYPWALILPSVIAAGIATFLILSIFNPAVANAFVSGAGYFVRTKAYTTIAEAQPPGLSQAILSFGAASYYLSLFGVFWMAVQFPRRQKPDYIFIIVWSFAAIFMAMSAARFIFNAGPAFVISAAWIITIIMDKLDFGGLRKTFRSLSGGSKFYALRKSVKVKHVLGVLFLAFLILLPNVWYAVDAAIPYEKKPQYEKDIYNSLPDFLRPPGAKQANERGGVFYLGAFGYSLPLTNRYFPQAWSWLSQQDTDKMPEDRPAFLSWWDYGFEAVDRGEHPTVADNFLGGHQLAGQFILAQSENQAISLLSILLLQSAYLKNGNQLPQDLRDVLMKHGLQPSVFESVFATPATYVEAIKADPVRFGSWDDVIQTRNNGIYIYLSTIMSEKLAVDQQALLYHDVREATGKSVRYFLVDTRLFPLDGTNTGIFYAPVKLTDHRVTELPDGRTIPIDFFNLRVNTNLGTFDIDKLPAGAQINSVDIVYKPMFYRSMFYRAYIGYTPTQAGLETDAGIPGLSGDAQNLGPMPGWNLSHFRLAYRTAYYNPYPPSEVQNHTDAWRAMDYFEALELQQKITKNEAQGTVDLSPTVAIRSGAVILKYYDGATVEGRLMVDDVTPVPDAVITISDEIGIPHYVTTTDSEGRYSALAPFGKITVTASTGPLNPRTLVGTAPLNETEITVTDDQAMRREIDSDGDGVPDYIIRQDLKALGGVIRGRMFKDLTLNGKFDEGEPLITDAQATIIHKTLGVTTSARASPSGFYVFNGVVAGSYSFEATWNGRTLTFPSSAFTGPEQVKELAVAVYSVNGKLLDENGDAVKGASVTAKTDSNKTIFTTTTDVFGNFAFSGLLPDSYDVSASTSESMSLTVRASIVNSTVDLGEMPMRPAGRLRGQVTFAEGDASYATLRFSLTGRVGASLTATADASGRYDVQLPEGEYDLAVRYYSDNRLFAYIGRASVSKGETAAMDVFLMPGATVRGTTYQSETRSKLPSSVVLLMNSQGMLRVQSGQNGEFAASLPLGEYQVYAFNLNKLETTSINLAGDKTLDLYLSVGEVVSGTVYVDVDRNGIRGGTEGLAGVKVTLRDNLGFEAVTFTDGKGYFNITVRSDRNYQAIVEQLGYEGLSLGPLTISDLRSGLSLSLSPKLVRVAGLAILNDDPLQGVNLLVNFRARGGSAMDASTLTAPDGRYDVNLFPGSYEIDVDQEVQSGDPSLRYQPLFEDLIEIPVGVGSQTLDIEIVTRTQVRGSLTLNGVPVDSTVNFTGVESKSVYTTQGSFELLLATGSYGVFSSFTRDGVEYATLQGITVTGPQEIEMELKPAVTVMGTLKSQGTAVGEGFRVEFSSSVGVTLDAESGGDGKYLINLLPGQYSVRLDERTSEALEEETIYVRYTFSGTLSVPSTFSGRLAYDIDLTKTRDNSTLKGNVTFGNTGIQATLTFVARDLTGLNTSTTSRTDGAYEVQISNGRYDVFVRSGDGSKAFLGTITVGPKTTQVQNFILSETVRFSGTTVLSSGLKTQVKLAIKQVATVEIESGTDGSFSIALPKGDYEVSAQVSVTERGMTIRYTDSEKVQLNSDLTLTLRLEKIITRKLFLDWNVEQQVTVNPGGVVKYIFNVENRGNSDDQVRLSASLEGWSFEFDKDRLNLGFGDSPDSKAQVLITIFTPLDALVFHSPVIVTATSDFDAAVTGNVRLTVGITEIRRLQVEAGTSAAQFDGRELVYDVQIQNRGNGVEDYTIQVLNREDLAAVGWTAELARERNDTGQQELSGYRIPANSTGTVVLKLVDAGGHEGPSVWLRVFSEEDPSVEATLPFKIALPSIAVEGGLTATGKDTVRSPTLFTSTFLVISGSVGVLLGVSALIIWRRRRRGR